MKFFCGVAVACLLMAGRMAAAGEGTVTVTEPQVKAALAELEKGALRLCSVRAADAQPLQPRRASGLTVSHGGLAGGVSRYFQWRCCLMSGIADELHELVQFAAVEVADRPIGAAGLAPVDYLIARVRRRLQSASRRLFAGPNE